MSIFKEIIDGYKNYFIKDEVAESIAMERAKICATCKFKKKGLHAAILTDVTLGEIQGYYCTACSGCPLSVKVRSKKHKCPKNKW